jgi:AraC-like DNA-binding protein
MPPTGVWSGDLASMPGRLRFTGRLGNVAAHHHAATQIIQVEHGHLDVVSGDRLVRVTSVVAIPAGHRHAIVATEDASGTVTYLDPDQVGGVRLDRLESDPGTVGQWLQAAGSASARHPALTAALAEARDLVHGPLLLRELAGRVGISPSRLGHLFTDELGLTYPNWRRWLRLQCAISEVLNGATMTDAAHAAGFTDSPHLTRTCREMFGMTPSQALATRRSLGS